MPTRLTSVAGITRRRGWVVPCSRRSWRGCPGWCTRLAPDPRASARDWRKPMIETIYRLVLKALPRDFRARFGTEILETARAIDDDPRRGVRRTVRAIADALATPIRLRAELQADPATPH